jgi:hypothetical protein
VLVFFFLTRWALARYGAARVMPFTPPEAP